jgi:hypothetical protein
MLRFTLNRWWALVLTLCLFTACFLFTAQVPSVASASTGSSSYMPSEDQPPVPALGDPDVPMGPGDGRHGGKSAASGRNQMVPQNGVRPVGDGMAPISVSMDRLRLFLLGLRSLYLSF